MGGKKQNLEGAQETGILGKCNKRYDLKLKLTSNRSIKIHEGCHMTHPAMYYDNVLLTMLDYFWTVLV